MVSYRSKAAPARWLIDTRPQRVVKNPYALQPDSPKGYFSFKLAWIVKGIANHDIRKSEKHMLNRKIFGTVKRLRCLIKVARVTPFNIPPRTQIKLPIIANDKYEAPLTCSISFRF